MTTVRAASSTAIRVVGRAAVRALGMATANIRPDPEFLLIGTKRGGTTSLFRHIETHPSFLPLFPSARVLPLRDNQKGVHYFDTGYKHSADWYQSHFATAVARRRRAEATGAAFTGEASPYYLYHPRAATRAFAELPDTRIVVMLRDPVERTVSHWSEQRRNGIERLDLEDALDAEEKRVGDDGRRLESGAIHESFAHEHQSYAGQSHYASSLERWCSRYPAEQVLVLFSENYYAEPEATIERLTAFLDVPSFDAPEIGVRNASPTTLLSASQRGRLEECFRVDATALAEMLGEAPPWPWLTA